LRNLLIACQLLPYRPAIRSSKFRVAAFFQFVLIHGTSTSLPVATVSFHLLHLMYCLQTARTSTGYNLFLKSLQALIFRRLGCGSELISGYTQLMSLTCCNTLTLINLSLVKKKINALTSASLSRLSTDATVMVITRAHDLTPRRGINPTAAENTKSEITPFEAY
jgi:hypothetical protein